MVLPVGWWSTRWFFFVLNCWRGRRTETRHYALDSTVPYGTLGWIQTSGSGSCRCLKEKSRVALWGRVATSQLLACCLACCQGPLEMSQELGVLAVWAGSTGSSVPFKSSQLISLLLNDPMYSAGCTFYRWMNSEAVKNIWLYILNFVTTVPDFMSSTVLFISSWNLVFFSFREWQLSFLLTCLFYLENQYKLY